jgi:hypothetical protein
MPPENNEEENKVAPSGADLRAAVSGEDLNDENLDTDDNNDDGTRDSSNEDEYTEVEQEAMAQGWNPDFDGPNARSASEYLDRSSFFKKIDSQKKRLDDQEKQINFLIARNKMSTDLAKKKVLEELKAQKKVAFEEQDFDAVTEIDEKIDTVKHGTDADDDANEFVTTNDSDGEVEPTPEFQSWITKNSWYNSDEEMHDTADALAMAYLKKKPEATSAETLEHVTKRIKVVYKDNFPGQKKSNNRSVEGDTRSKRQKKSSSSSGKHSVSDLNFEERKVMSNMIQSGHVKNEEAYIKSLEKTGYFNS